MEWRKKSAKKFADREIIWQEIYEFAGLRNINSKYVGNYNRLEKVIKRLEKFGIEKSKAEEAYNKIIFNKS